MSNQDGNNINNRDIPPLLAAISSLSTQGLFTTSSSVSTPTAATPTAAATANSYNEYSTPTTTATTTASFNPTADVSQEWTEFCKGVNVSPPKRINKALLQVKGEANYFLRMSGLRRNVDGSIYTWDSLEDLQQAGMAFLINEGIIDCFPREENKYRRIAHGVLGIDKVDNNGNIIIHGSSIWRDLHQFVRKRGDLIKSNGNWRTNHGGQTFHTFRSRHNDLWGDNRKGVSCNTTFSLNLSIEPVLRLQAEFSMVCAFVVSSLMIHYRQVIEAAAPTSGATASASMGSAWSKIAEATPGNQGIKQTPQKSLKSLFSLSKRSFRKARGSNTLGSGPGAPASSPASSPANTPVTVIADNNTIETKAGNCTLNIGRYMRHNLTAMQKYKTIFEGEGFSFEDVMKDLLSLSNDNAPMGGFLDSIDITQNEAPQYFFNEVTKQLRYGGLCARIRLYEGYEQETMCVKEPTMNFLVPPAHHFVTIVGISLTDEQQHGGIMFVAQDSLGEQPFKNISLELLRMMDSTSRLLFIPHNVGIKMPNDSVFDINPEDIATAGGLQLSKSEFPRCTDGPISEEEKKQRKEKRELLKALVEPNYLPEWSRGFYESNGKNELDNDAAVVHADTVEGGRAGVVVADMVEGEGIEVEYKA